MATSLPKSKRWNLRGLALEVYDLDVLNNLSVVGTQAFTGIATFTTIKNVAGSHLLVNSGTTATDIAGKTIRLNSITNTGTADSFIGFQSKPRQGASMANNVIGAEISAQISDTFALTGSGSLIGLHSDVYLRGTAAGTIAGDVRGAQIELVTDDAGTRTITGNVVALRIRAAFSGTITGDMTAIRIEKAETQTNSKQWEYVLELTDVNGLIWDDDFGTEPSTAAGGFKVRINGQDRWVQTYSGAPVS